MVRITKDKEIYIKILFYGSTSTHKTEFVNVLYNVCNEGDKDLIPTGELTKITMSSGVPLYFDRGIFQSKKQKNIFFHCYTVAGQKRFKPLREKVFKGTDGVIFIVGTRRSHLKDNIDCLKELNNVLKGDLIKKIPLAVVLERGDSNDVISSEKWKEILSKEDLFFEESDPLYEWNPHFYEISIEENNTEKIYKIFSNMARNIIKYQIYGDGRAPI
ncbi:MAG: ADP-ribosylation factor-like protein [Promethearchaeota archaeon]